MLPSESYFELNAAYWKTFQAQYLCWIYWWVYPWSAVGELSLITEVLTDPRNPAPAPGQPRPVQLRALTSVRFFAALHVALYHIVRPFSAWGIFAGFMGAGHSAVPFFFLLSGFILTYSHAREPETGTGFKKRFYFARFARIYPLYVLSLIVVAAAYPPVFDKRIHILAFVGDLAMIQSWSSRMVNFFNIPAWSLSCEAFFYLVFPFVFLKLRPKSKSNAVWWIVGLWVLAMVPPLIGLYLTPAQAWDESVMGGLLVFRIRRIPLLMLAEFLAGIPLAWLFLRFRPSRRTASALLAVGGVGLATGLFFAKHIPYVMIANGVLIPFYAMLILGLCEDNWLTRALSVGPLVLLGEASYALYLFHYTFSDWVGNRFGGTDSFVAAAIKIAMLIPITIGLHLLVERPCRKVLLQWWNRKHPRTARA